VRHGRGRAGVSAATTYRDLAPVAVAQGTSLTNVVQRLGASFGTVVVALILSSRTAAAEADVGAAFAGTFWSILGFAAVTLPVALLLPGRRDPRARRAGAGATPAALVTNQSGPRSPGPGPQ